MEIKKNVCANHKVCESYCAIRGIGVSLCRCTEMKNSCFMCILVKYYTLLSCISLVTSSLQRANGTTHTLACYDAVTISDCSKSNWQEHTFSIQHYHASLASITIPADCFKQTCVMSWNKGSLRLATFCTWQDRKSHENNNLTFHLLEYFTSKSINRERRKFSKKSFGLL